MVGWGSTFGPIHQAVRRALAKGQDVAHVHVRHIWPMPKNMSVLFKGFKHILVPEMNMGQFKTVLRDQFLVDAKSLTKVRGHPFRIAEIEAAIERTLARRLPRLAPMDCEHSLNDSVAGSIDEADQRLGRW